MMGTHVRHSNHVDIGMECVGCHACAMVCPDSCIAMSADEHGFLYPLVDHSCCTECGLCRRACPVIDRVAGHDAPTSYGCRALDDSVREASSSGGVFTLLAEEVIRREGVVFGAAFDDDFCVVHQRAQDTDELVPLRGSKYVQSEVGLAYRDIATLLENGTSVLFSGTPCQTAGLRSYLGGKSDDLICVDVVCHGVPSPLVWRQYVTFQEEVHGSALRAVAFRDKSSGWRSYSVQLEFDSGAVCSQTVGRDLFMRAFLRDLCLRPSCYSCKFKGLSRDSDITLADFWGIERVIPSMDDDWGTSLVMIHSSRGQGAFGTVQDRMLCQPVDTALAVRGNPAAIRSAIKHTKYDEFFRNLGQIPFDRLVARYCTPSLMDRVRGVLVRAARTLRDLIKKSA